MNKATPFIEGDRIDLLPFTEEMISDNYLNWLNDSKVNEFSRRLFGPSNRRDALKFFNSLNADDYVLAINYKETGEHVGNIQYGPVNWKDSFAEIRIVVGEKSVWGKGIATEAIALVTKHIFEVIGLNRVEANSCNPAFIKCMNKLGWKQEGVMRQRFYAQNEFHDYYFFGLLKEDYSL